MHVFIVYAHPSEGSFTHSILEAFIAGLAESDHSYEISDLYKMNFKTDLDLAEYERESGREKNRDVPEDVKREQEKINRADVLVLIYPLWWSDCPAKMKGWFDRVYSRGFAYECENEEHMGSQMKLKKALVICAAGHSVEHLEEIGILKSMRTVMLNDRLIGVGAEQAEMVVLGGTISGEKGGREKSLQKAFELGKNI